jgi:hypothetical protein
MSPHTLIDHCGCLLWLLLKGDPLFSSQKEYRKVNVRLHETISNLSALLLVASPVVSGQLAGLDALYLLFRCSEQGR